MFAGVLTMNASSARLVEQLFSKFRIDTSTAGENGNRACAYFKIIVFVSTVYAENMPSDPFERFVFGLVGASEVEASAEEITSSSVL